MRGPARSKESQSNPFQARVMPCSANELRCRRAKTISSSLSGSYSMPASYVRPTSSTSLAISRPQRVQYPRRTRSPREIEPLRRSTDAVVRHTPHQKLLSSRTLSPAEQRPRRQSLGARNRPDRQLNTPSRQNELFVGPTVSLASRRCGHGRRSKGRTRRSRQSRSLCWHGRCRGSFRVRAGGGNEGPGGDPAGGEWGCCGDDCPHVARHRRQVTRNSALLVQEVPNIGDPRSYHLRHFQRRWDPSTAHCAISERL